MTRHRLLTALFLTACALAGFLVLRPRATEVTEDDKQMKPLPSVARSLARTAEWPAYQMGGELQGRTAWLGPPGGGARLRLRWERKAAPVGSASPAISGGLVYIGDSEGVVRAYDLATGDERWRYEAEGGISTAPLVIEDTLFIGDGDGVFHALDTETGTARWRFEAEGDIHSSANTEAGRIYFGSYDYHLYCLDPADGREIWRFEISAQVHPTPAISGGLVFTGGCDSVLHAVDAATGRERWRAELGSAVATAPTCFGGETATACVAIGTLDGEVAAYTVRDGKEVWRRRVEGESFYGSPAFAEGVLVFPGRNGGVYGLDAGTGEEKWRFRSREGFDASPAVCCDPKGGARVYGTCKDGRLYVLDLATGRELWRFEAGGGIECSPAIVCYDAGGGALVFGDESGTIYCLEP